MPLVAVGVVSSHWWGLAGFGLGVLAPFASCVGVALGFPAVIALHEGIAAFGDLGPVTAAFVAARAGAPAAIGALLGRVGRGAADRLLARAGRDPLSRRAVLSVATLVPLGAVAGAFASAAVEAGERPAREARARAKLVEAWRAQAARQRRSGVPACRWGELDVAFSGRVVDHPPTSTARHGGYRFSLRCRKEGAAFQIHAYPERYGRSYARKAVRSFCVDASGTLRAWPGARGAETGDRCLADGRIVARPAAAGD